MCSIQKAFFSAGWGFCFKLWYFGLSYKHSFVTPLHFVTHFIIDCDGCLFPLFCCTPALGVVSILELPAISGRTLMFQHCEIMYNFEELAIKGNNFASDQWADCINSFLSTSGLCSVWKCCLSFLDHHWLSPLSFLLLCPLVGVWRTVSC